VSTPGATPLRRPTSVHGITGLRFLPQNAPATLVNISSTGLLAETVARLTVGSTTTVALEGGFTPATVSGRVVRCEVAVMGRDGMLRYHLGLECDSPLAIDEGAGAAAAPGATPPTARNRW